MNITITEFFLFGWAVIATAGWLLHRAEAYKLRAILKTITENKTHRAEFFAMTDALMERVRKAAGEVL